MNPACEAALVGLLVSTAAFCGYLFAMYKEASSGGGTDQSIIDTMVDAIKSGQISLRGALVDFKGGSNGDGGKAIADSLRESLRQDKDTPETLRLKKGS